MSLYYLGLLRASSTDPLRSCHSNGRGDCFEETEKLMHLLQFSQTKISIDTTMKPLNDLTMRTNGNKY